jgi:hypothetical protein
MKNPMIWTAVLTASLAAGCATGPGAADERGGAGRAAAAAEPADPGETKVKLDQTPDPVRKTIERQLVGAQLEDISKKQRDGKTVYETDIIKRDGKWEVVVAEDGSIVSNLKEGSPQEQEADKKDNAAEAAAFRQNFNVDKSNLLATGDNKYLTIRPGRVLKMRSGIDTLTITILRETKTVDGVECGVLEERETKDGKLIEISRNYFATDKTTGDVYYFGEDVDNYLDGKVVNHDSTWHAGRNGARFGLMMPARPKVGDKFQQEIAPKEAMDRVEIVSIDETVKTPAGTFEHCVHFRETTPLEADVSHKYYAPGVGMIKDDEFELAEKP